MDAALHPEGAYVHRYPVVPVEITHKGKKRSIKAVVSSRLMHPLILGTDWPGFNRLVGQCVGVRSRSSGTWDMRTVLSGDPRLPSAADRGGGTGGAFTEG